MSEPTMIERRDRQWAVEADADLLAVYNGSLRGHQNNDILEAIRAARRLLNACLKCGSIRDEPCLSGGYLPVGELPGDPIQKPHRERRARR